MKQSIGELHYHVSSEVRRGRRVVVLDKRLAYVLYTEGHELLLSVIVPRGFKSDLASIPRILWPLLPCDGPYQEAAVIHDYLYSLADVPRWLCDAVFRHVMQATGIRWTQRVVLFWGVRIGGWAARKSSKRSK